MDLIVDQPPLWTWPAAAGLAGLVLGLLWLGVLQYEPDAKAFHLNTARLSAARGSRPLVVFIGSSKIRCAVEADSRFEARLARLGTAARVVRFSEGLATPRDYADLFERLPASRPAIVAIESEMVDLEPNVFRANGTSPYRGWRERMRRVLDYRFAPSAAIYAGRENRDPAVDDCKFVPATPAERQQALATRRASTAAERAPFYLLARRLKAMGVPVILLALPDRHDDLGAIPPALATAKMATKGQSFATGLFIDLGNPPPLAPGYFLDNGHLGVDGKGLHSSWLAPRIAALLQRRAQR